MLSVEEIKRWTGVGWADGSQDDFLATELEPKAVAALNRWTGLYWGEPQARTEILDGDGRSRFLELAVPAYSITSVHTRGSWGTGSWALMPSTYYEHVTDGPAEDLLVGARLYFLGACGHWTGGQRNIRVIYRAGYALPDVAALTPPAPNPPEDAKLAVGQLVAALYAHRGKVRSAPGDDVSLDDFPAMFRETVKGLTRPPRRQWSDTMVRRA